MRASFESGFQATFLVVAVVALVGFVVTVLFVGHRRVEMARPSES